MLPSRTASAIILLTALSLLVTTTMPATAQAPIQTASPMVVSGFQEGSEGTDEDVEEEEDEGWFGGAVNSIVETGGDAIGGAKDRTVSGASTAWGVAEDAPGATWGVAEQAPGVIWGSLQDGWDWLRNNASGSVEWGGWADFIAQYPLLGAILGPLVLFLIGLSPDGTISYAEIAIGITLFLLPGMQLGGVLAKVGKTVKSSFPGIWDNAAQARKNPGGVVNAVIDTWQVMRAPTIRPIAGDFADLPEAPGVYVMLDDAGNALYVGMSGNLKQRVPNHFSVPPREFADDTVSIKILKTESRGDARALECRLIQQLDPRDNKVRTCPAYTSAPTLVFH